MLNFLFYIADQKFLIKAILNFVFLEFSGWLSLFFDERKYILSSLCRWQSHFLETEITDLSTYQLKKFSTAKITMKTSKQMKTTDDMKLIFLLNGVHLNQ